MEKGIVDRNSTSGDDSRGGNKDEYQSDIRCCFCFKLPTGIKILLVFGIFDILHLIGNVLAAGFYSTLLQTNDELKAKE